MQGLKCRSWGDSVLIQMVLLQAYLGRRERHSQDADAGPEQSPAPHSRRQMAMLQDELAHTHEMLQKREEEVTMMMAGMMMRDVFGENDDACHNDHDYDAILMVIDMIIDMFMVIVMAVLVLVVMVMVMVAGSAAATAAVAKKHD